MLPAGIKALFFLCAVILVYTGCNGKHRKRSGWIKVELVVYNDPTGDLHDSFRIPVSKLYFLDGSFIEELPNYTDSTGSGLKYLYIRDGMYAKLMELEEISDPGLVFRPLSEKDAGVRFSESTVAQDAARINLPDTAFGGYQYRRVALPADSNYTVFYIHQTDTLLPFSFSRQFDTEYGGVLSRIDSYEFRNNRFSSLRLIVGDTIPIAIYQTFLLINN